jgi:ribosomal protein S11
MQGSVITHGDDAMAVFGQSIGGGGGLATLGCSNTNPTNSAHLASACWGNTQVSGTGGQPAEFVGAAGTNGVAITVNDAQTGSESSDTGAGAINVYSSQTITTYGDRSMGLVTQSITGGGGFFSAPNRRIHSVSMPTQQRATNLSPGATTINVANSTITTYGDGAWGVFAQMVQGGGGFFGDSSQDLAFNVKYSQAESAASDVFAGSTSTTVGAQPSGFTAQRVANANAWSVSSCESSANCVVNTMTPGQLYLIPFQDGQVNWSSGDYVQLEQGTDQTFPFVLKQYNSQGSLKTTVGTGRVLHLSEDYFFFEGNDQFTGSVFAAKDITANSLTLSGIERPSVNQVTAYLQQYFGGAATTASSSALNQVLNTNYLPRAATGDTWTNNPISVELYKTQLSTYGKNSHGIVLQNLGSVGGAWSSNSSKLNMGITLDGSNGNGNTPGGNISLTVRVNSEIHAYGEGSRAVVIQSDGAGPGGNSSQGKITVQVSDSSEIFSKQHTALMIVGGSFSATRSKTTTSNCGVGCQSTTTTYLQNEVYVDGTSSITSGAYSALPTAAVDNSDSAYNKWAIYAPTGYTNVENSGTITGNVLLGILTRGEFTNSGALHGSTVSVANNSLHNYGTIYAGGEGATGGLFIDGSLKHYEGGEIHVDVHPLGDGETHDVITVTGLARIQGEIVPQTQSLLPGDYQFLTAGTLDYSGSVRNAHVFSWEATVDGNTLAKTPTANFAPAGYGLTGNQTSLAGYLQRSWDASTADHAPLFGYLHEHGLGEHSAYQSTLNELMGQTLNAQPIQFQTAFSTYMSESLSCPTVTAQGLRLNQDDCAWAKVTGDISDQSANSSNPGFRATGGGIRMGAQRSLGNGWTAGFGAGYALNYLTSTNFSSNGQFLDLSVSAKKQIEQWEFGGSLGYAQGWFQNNRYRAMGANGAADAMDGVFASDSRMSIMGLRLRAAYEHELDKDHYLKPYVDVDLSYSSMPGFSETGTAPLALNVGSSSRWNVAITPMLEYGLDVITEDKSRVKLFASAGASFLPNNSHKSETSFVGASAALGTFDVITDGPGILGRLNLGIQAFHSDDLEVRAQYGLLAGDGYWSQSVSANLVWRF